MLNTIFIFILALFLVMKGATLATRYATKLADAFHLSKYTVGFIIIAVISILPETFISLNAAVQGIPSFGLGMLFGSNVADLTLVFALIVLFAKRGIRVESNILKNRFIYPFLLFLPLVLGADGYFSRFEGIALIIAGGVFYYAALKDGVKGETSAADGEKVLRNAVYLLGSMALLLVGSHFTVESASVLATAVGVSPILVGMLVVGLGTTMPEFLFALKSVKRRNDSMAVGDILGTVLADATIVVGLLALVRPFIFPQKIVYLTGFFMVMASVLLFAFMKTKRTLSRKEGLALFLFWLVFVIAELVANVS